MRDETFYQDLGASHFRRTSPQDRANCLARQIEKLGLLRHHTTLSGGFCLEGCA